MDLITFSLGLSLHLGFENEYNFIHPHVRYQNESFIAGAYYNSEEKISPYVGTRFEHNDFGFEIGAVGGYETDALKAMPYVRATYKDYFIAPGIEGDKTGIVLGIDYKF